jgi:hypothetical protein
MGRGRCKEAEVRGHFEPKLNGMRRGKVHRNRELSTFKHVEARIESQGGEAAWRQRREMSKCSEEVGDIRISCVIKTADQSLAFMKCEHCVSTWV